MRFGPAGMAGGAAAAGVVHLRTACPSRHPAAAAEAEARKVGHLAKERAISRMGESPFWTGCARATVRASPPGLRTSSNDCRVALFLGLRGRRVSGRRRCRKRSVGRPNSACPDSRATVSISYGSWRVALLRRGPSTS